MTRTPVESSNVSSFGYQPVLEVEFKGGAVYQYEGVPPEVVEQIRQSPSFGAALSRLVVKGPYTFVKVRDGRGRGAVQSDEKEGRTNEDPRL